MAQWTIASSPGHPILLDTIRRIFFFTTRVSAWKVANANNTAVLDQFRDELNAAMGPINVLEWTGPGVWSDAFMRYVLAKYDIKWNQFRDMKTPLRATEMCVLPVTGTFLLSFS
jgi:alpha 1,6-mannosyltransferase